MTLAVFAEARLVGEIHEEAGGPRLVYDQAWARDATAFPLSLTMPRNEAEVAPERFVPWASNLLPEAEQLAMVGRQLGVAQSDLVALLEAIGRDTAGALSFGAPGATSRQAWRPVGTAAALERIIEELPNKPFLAGEDGVSMSLAGVQTKLAVARDDDGGLYIPLDGSPSTHILKPDSPRLPGSVQNEAFCLALARRCGLSVPWFTTGVAGKRSYFLIARYDRAASVGDWLRLHQEDFCQAMGRPPAAKYERNRTGTPGPTLAELVAVVRRHALAPDVLALVDMAAFNILVCNTDAHAKNYSLLLPAAARPRLAPLYDVMCAEPYDGITRHLAQTIAGKNRGDHLKRRHWLRFAENAGLGAAPLVRRLRALAETVVAGIAVAQEEVAEMPAGSHPLLPAAAEAVAARCRAIIAGLDDDSR